MFSNFFPRKLCVDEIMWKNSVEPERPQMTTWRMLTACWTLKATNTLSEHVILRLHCNNAGKNEPQYHVIRALPALSKLYNVSLIVQLKTGRTRPSHTANQCVLVK